VLCCARIDAGLPRVGWRRPACFRSNGGALVGTRNATSRGQPMTGRHSRQSRAPAGSRR
jgi:hypothetical protein